MVLLRLEFGVLSRGKMGPTELVSEYLRLGKTNEVEHCVRILVCVPITSCSHECMLTCM